MQSLERTLTFAQLPFFFMLSPLSTFFEMQVLENMCHNFAKYLLYNIN